MENFELVCTVTKFCNFSPACFMAFIVKNRYVVTQYKLLGKSMGNWTMCQQTSSPSLKLQTGQLME